MRNSKKDSFREEYASGTRRPHNSLNLVDRELSVFTRIPKLKFQSVEPLPIASRDYGLMKSSNKSSTPYPRAQQGVDASLLKARLIMRTGSDNRNHSRPERPERPEKPERPERPEDGSPSISDGSSHRWKTLPKSKPSVSVFRRPSLTRSIKDIVAVGTPHPKKGVALNPKVLGRRLTDINEMLWKTTDMSEHSMPSLVKPKGLKTKRKVLLATPEESRESEFLHRPGAPPNEELVGEGVSPRLTHTDCEDTMCSICEEFQEPQLSFAERRKISQEGEYTIAKYGRKMSDIMMAAPNPNQEVDDKSVRYAKKASLEMERYMRSQGLVKISNDQVTMTRNMARISAQMN